METETLLEQLARKPVGKKVWPEGSADYFRNLPEVKNALASAAVREKAIQQAINETAFFMRQFIAAANRHPRYFYDLGVERKRVADWEQAPHQLRKIAAGRTWLAELQDHDFGRFGRQYPKTVFEGMKKKLGDALVAGDTATLVRAVAAECEGFWNLNWPKIERALAGKGWDAPEIEEPARIQQSPVIRVNQDFDVRLGGAFDART